MIQKFYFPLTCHVHESNGWGIDWDNAIESDGRTAYFYRGDIENALDEYNDGDENMAQYFYRSEHVKAKIVSAVWKFEAVNRCLFGRVDIITTEPMTDDETEVVKSWICGQNSDGLGEGFEQYRIDTRDGNTIFVSFWNTRDDYIIMTEAEFIAAKQGGIS